MYYYVELLTDSPLYLHHHRYLQLEFFLMVSTIIRKTKYIILEEGTMDMSLVQLTFDLKCGGLFTTETKRLSLDFNS